MGFTTGFLSGTTLTLTLSYLILQSHRINRANQASTLRYQSHTLDLLADPYADYPTRPSRHQRPKSASPSQSSQTQSTTDQPQPSILSLLFSTPSSSVIRKEDEEWHREPPGIAEELKTRWNHEIEKVVVAANETDWRGLREDVEGFVKGVYGNLQRAVEESGERQKRAAREAARELGEKDGKGA